MTQIKPHNIQLVSKDRKIRFLPDLTKADLQIMGRVTIFFLGNKYSTIGLDVKNRLVLSRECEIGLFVKMHIENNLMNTEDKT